MTDQRRHPIAAAMEWVAKITTVGLEMVLPAIGGAYLDRRLHTSYWVILGLVIGGVVGFWHLLQMTNAASSPRGDSHGEKSNRESKGE